MPYGAQANRATAAAVRPVEAPTRATPADVLTAAPRPSRHRTDARPRADRRSRRLAVREPPPPLHRAVKRARWSAASSVASLSSVASSAAAAASPARRSRVDREDHVALRAEPLDHLELGPQPRRGRGSSSGRGRHAGPRAHAGDDRALDARAGDRGSGPRCRRRARARRAPSAGTRFIGGEPMNAATNRLAGRVEELLRACRTAAPCRRAAPPRGRRASSPRPGRA